MIDSVHANKAIQSRETKAGQGIEAMSQSGNWEMLPVPGNCRAIKNLAAGGPQLRGAAPGTLRGVLAAVEAIKAEGAMKYHRAPQFDLPAQESAFNLAGQLIREEPPKPKLDTKPDLTPELFGETTTTKEKTK